jgi:hypothetical protein
MDAEISANGLLANIGISLRPGKGRVARSKGRSSSGLLAADSTGGTGTARQKKPMAP